MKRFLVLLICAALLAGCGQRVEEETELWVVTEQTDNNAILQQIELVIDRFSEQYPDVPVRLDILPGNEEARAAYLQKIRAEVMSGGGPDVYIMPTSPATPPAGEESSTPYLEPLYSDVVQQMYNGIFTDISEYYDADEDLGRETLVTAVMDAGVMDGARYVLPLRYDYEILLVDMDAMEELGVDMSAFDGSIDDIYDLALNLNDEIAAHALNVAPFYCSLSDFLDQEKGNVLIDASEAAEIFENSRKVDILANEEAHQDVGHWIQGLWIVTEYGYEGYFCDIDSYIYNGNSKKIFTNAGYPFYRIELSECVDAAAAIKQSGDNIAMYPIRAADGSMVAEITYYGAVGSGCEDPELAYELLRAFLTEEIQWEQYWPRNSGMSNVEDRVAEGHPVRTVGSAEPVYENIRKQIQAAQRAAIKQRMYEFVPERAEFIDENFTIDDSDVPALTVQIDEARFPVTTAQGEIFSQYLARFQAGEEALPLAEEMIEELKWLLAEG